MARPLIGAARIAFLDTFAYRSVLFLWAIVDVTYPLALIFVWLTVYNGQTTVAGLTEVQMLLYYVGVLIVMTTVSIHSEWDISDHIRSGHLRFFLTKPIPYALFMVIDAIVWRIYSASISVPIAFAIVWSVNRFLDLDAPYPVSGQFLLALVGSLGIFASMSVCLGFLAFFLERVNGAIHANDILRAIASGYLLPLALFPDWAQSLLRFLPYPYLLDFPVQNLIGTVTSAEFVQGFLLQGLWTAVFSVVAAGLWYLGIRRYDAPEQIGSGVEV